MRCCDCSINNPQNSCLVTWLLTWNIIFWVKYSLKNRLSLCCTKILINEQNILPFVYHTISLSNLHPVPQQISPPNSSSVQRRIPNSVHFWWAFENVSVEQSGMELSQDVPSIWYYGLLSFQAKDAKLEKNLHKNQHT